MNYSKKTPFDEIERLFQQMMRESQRQRGERCIRRAVEDALEGTHTYPAGDGPLSTDFWEYPSNPIGFIR